MGAGDPCETYTCVALQVSCGDRQSASQSVSGLCLVSQLFLQHVLLHKVVELG